MKPCPFCKGEDLAIIPDVPWSYRVACTGCGCTGPGGRTEVEALVKWNVTRNSDEVTP